MVAGDKTARPMTSYSGGIPQPHPRIRQRIDREPKESGMRSFVNGIVSPFTACWQPSLDSCAPVCGSRDFRTPRQRTPSVVSPLVDRMGYQPPPPSSPRSDASHGYESGCASPSQQLADQLQQAADIEKPHSNDVLCGRGGSSNRHLGNMHFRELVAANKKTYVSLTKKQKMLIARKIVETVHGTEPAGRFLAKDLDTGLWYDIGLPRSLEKTSQALREKNSNDFPVGPDDASEAGSGADVPVTGLSCGVEGDKRTKARRGKNVEAPPLIIPPHLKRFYFPRQPLSPYHEPSWSEYPPSAGRHLEQPYLHQSPASPRGAGDPYAVSPRTPSYQYENNPPPRSPPHYHYDNRMQYGQHHTRSPMDYEHPSPDHRESYDYYRRPADYRDPYARHPPHGRGHPANRPPPQGHYSSYPPPRPAMHYHGRPPAHPPTSPNRHHDHYGYTHSPPTVPATAPPPVMYRTPSNSYVRGKSEMSPERRQEWKRQRNDTGHARRLSDSSLSNAVETSLTIQDRGRPEPSTPSRRPTELTSPSGILQSRSRRSLDGPKKKESGDAGETDVSRLSGLAALSTAAFLKLDEN